MLAASSHLKLSPFSNTLCLGGSFNPIHHGHLICAREVAENSGYSAVLLVPNGQPPHKRQTTDLAAAADRLRMCELAISEVDGGVAFDLLDYEIRRSEPSYTIDTARELRRRGYQKIDWLIGADMLNTLRSWREPQALLREVNFVVMARPGFDFAWNDLGDDYTPLRQKVVAAPLIDISATQIRRRVGAGQSIDYLTPPKVVEFIRQRGLYRSAGTAAR